MQTDIPTAIAIPRNPGRGEVWFSLNLAAIPDLEAVLKLLRQLDLTPKPAYLPLATGIEVHWLLAHRTFETLPLAPHALYEYEQQQLSELCSDAITFSCGLTREVVAMFQ